MNQSPMTEFAHDGTECFAGRRAPRLKAGAISTGAAFDESVMLQSAQPRDQYRTRYQRYAAKKVVEGVNIGHHFAQNERRPALGEDFRRLRDRAELIIPAFHVIHW